MRFIEHNTQPIEVWRPGVSTRMRVSALTGSTELAVFEQWCAPGNGAPTHWHPVEEVLTVLSGTAEIWVEGEYLSAAAGHSALIPAKVRHGFRNAGGDELHMLAILASPVFEAHFDDRRELSRRWSADSET